MEDKATPAMKEFLERMKKLQEKTGAHVHYIGCGEYKFVEEPQPKEEDGSTQKSGTKGTVDVENTVGNDE